ncbi:2-keto-4-pentenoate hydratase [Paraburkholderia sp. Ac-20342]|uniref:2-keto-4-pentenoate hydratase n=1 Tax=unclassified Paraburkholderia TaxID=2615204 RepID=UPI001421D3AC|nr:MULTISPECIES: fumarylacetoacetate hydrolase family protein [unclassified Paraburkholderia]MBN3845843.1 2-keto-4-pentenoate hydratase [Paraburkholderia sp. Ac-20342]NIF77381.1 2-keto-4-pentenoate hydratase [Paraburkholderia sp. Cy-641]
MNAGQIKDAASALRAAAHTHAFLAPLRETYPDMTIDDAYAVQSENVQWRIDEGRRIVGAKIGLTSVAVQRQLGVDQPDFGVLFDDMSFGHGEPVPVGLLTQPKVEAEIAFVLGRDIHVGDAGHATFADVVAAVDYALPAIEIVGSRIANWNIGIVDTVADNASSSAFVLGGRPVKLDAFDLRLCGMLLERRGEPVSVGAGAACLGHPLNAVTWLARTVIERGTPLRAGSVVLSGALGPMVSVEPGDRFEAHIHGLGSVSAVFESHSKEPS